LSSVGSQALQPINPLPIIDAVNGGVIDFNQLTQWK
jgi:hypothetical protein